MNSKVLTIVSLSAAVVALSAAVAVRSVKRAETARFVAERAASSEEIAARESRKAEAEAKTAEARAKARAAEAAKAKAEAEARVADQKAKALEAAAAEKNAAAEAEARAAAKERSRAAAEAAAQAKAEAAKAASEAARAQAEERKAKAEAAAAADRLALQKEKAAEEAAAAKVLELRKIDFETWQTRLAELDQELAERERALRPEATVYNSSNITWVAEREADVIGGTGTVRRAKRKAVRPEDDPALPRPTRRLAKSERLVAARAAELEQASSNAVVTALERLYVRALEERRVIDADYYARSILLLYPQWTYRPPATAKKGNEP